MVGSTLLASLPHADEAIAERAVARADSLMQVSEILIAGETLDVVVRAVFDIVRRELTLTSAVCTFKHAAPVEWHAPGVSEVKLELAVSRAHAVDRFLSGDDVEWPSAHGDAAAVLGGSVFINLPLAVASSAAFGSVQIEGHVLAEADLAFVSVVAHQLASAASRLVSASVRASNLHAQTHAKTLEVEIERDEAELRFLDVKGLHERYEALLDNLESAFVWEADVRALRLTYVSARVSEVLGFSRDTLNADESMLARYLHPDDVALITDKLVAVLVDGRDVSFVHRCMTAAGGVRWLKTGVHVVGVDEGRPRFQGVSVDVTEMKLAEQRALYLADVSERLVSATDYRAVLQEMTRMATPLLGDVFLLDELSDSGSLVRLGAEVRIDAAKAEAVVRAASLDAPHAATARARALGTAQPFLLGEGPGADESYVRALRAAGIASLIVMPIVARDSVLGVFTFAATGAWGGVFTSRDMLFAQDLARRCASALDTARLYDEAQRAVRARQDLLAIVSHDLKNPLSVILLNLDMLTRFPPEKDQRRSRRQLVSISRAAETMNALIADLLDVSHVEALRLSVNARAITAASLASDAVDALALLAAEKGLRLIAQVAAELPLVRADRARIRQSFANLVGNAIKFTPRGGTVRLTADVHQMPGEDDAVLFSVADTGPGIAAEHLPYIFDRFWQAPGAARLGTGLGLFIVKGIVEAHGGRAWVESTVGVGTTFFFTLSAAPMDERSE